VVHGYAAIIFTAVDRLLDHRMCGYWMAEVAYPWLALAAAGWRVVSVSTAQAPPLPGGVDRSDRTQREFLDDEAAQRALKKTRRAEYYEPGDFGAVVFAGGAGAVFDLPKDAAMAKFTSGVLDGGGIVAATGYGVAGLLGVVALDDGILTARRVTCPSPAEERAQELSGRLPLRLPDELTCRGAVVQLADAFRPHVVADGAIITGQNPASAPEVARRLLSSTTALS
jgi:putative intracellular protease/amidase